MGIVPVFVSFSFLSFSFFLLSCHAYPYSVFLGTACLAGISPCVWSRGRTKVLRHVGYLSAVAHVRCTITISGDISNKSKREKKRTKWSKSNCIPSSIQAIVVFSSSLASNDSPSVCSGDWISLSGVYTCSFDGSFYYVDPFPGQRLFHVSCNQASNLISSLCRSWEDRDLIDLPSPSLYTTPSTKSTLQQSHSLRIRPLLRPPPRRPPKRKLIPPMPTQPPHPLTLRTPSPFRRLIHPLHQLLPLKRKRITRSRRHINPLRKPLNRRKNRRNARIPRILPVNKVAAPTDIQDPSRHGKG